MQIGLRGFASSATLVNTADDSVSVNTEVIGVDFGEHDLRFVQDDWESPTLGASGLGWEVWLDSLEVTQFTYFQKVGGFALKPITCELTYGLERICMFLH